MNEIVKYENQFNATALRKFNAVDLDFLMLLCQKFRDKGTETIKFDLTEIRNLANYKFEGNDRLIQDLKQMNSKLLGCNFMYQDTHKIVQFVLFSTFEIDLDDLTLEVAVNHRFAFLLNSLDKNFTRFELSEFLSLRSSYAKECYRRLKQFRTQGWWEVSIDEFKRLLDIPDNYRMCDIDKWVLQPIQHELTPLLTNFTVTKKYKRGRGRGGKVVKGLEFHFQPDKVVDSTKLTESQLQLTSHICPKCHNPLYETVLNGSNCWCHNFLEQGDDCKAIYNSVADIKGYSEIPAPHNTSLSDKKAVLENMRALKNKMAETLNE